MKKHNYIAFLKRVLKCFAYSFALALLWNLLFALLYDNGVDKRLKAENAVYRKVYPQMQEDLYLLEAVTKALSHRDAAIYTTMFQSSIPESSDFENAMASEELDDHDLARYTRTKLDNTLKAAAAVDSAFRRSFGIMLSDPSSVPPMSAPVEGFSSIRAGASVGQKMSPFLQMEVNHGGLDIIAPSGSEVLATADGQVQEIVRSSKGHGNMVSIRHGGGYITRYGNLGSIRVQRGQKVRVGTVIGTVGMSGLSYAPHVHYEISRDSLVFDPARYMFASVTAHDYADLQVVSSSTGQSLD